MKKKIFAAVAAVAALGAFSLYGATKATKALKKTPSSLVKGSKTALVQKDFAQSQTFNIGEPGSSGGTVFFENKNYAKDGWRYLEAFWSDETIGVKYKDGAKFVSEINSGKVSGMKSTQGDWYIPGKEELALAISALGYPKGMLPPGRYFVNGGKDFVSFDFDLRTKQQTLNKIPERLAKIKLTTPKFTGKNAKSLKTTFEKRASLEEKRKSVAVGNFIIVRKITSAELSKKAKFKFTLGQKLSPKDFQRIRQSAQSSSSQNQQQQQQQNEYLTEVTYLPSGENSALANYSAIDSYALSLDIPTSMSIADAARKICQTAKSDIEKARAIFAWIGYNITYDYDSLNALTQNEQIEIGIYNGDKTYERRTGVCAGYSALFKKMADAVGLQDAKYHCGYSKQITSKYNDALGGYHAWNSVKIGGRTVLIDSTWGAAYSQNGSGVPVLVDSWFDCDPELFVLSHYPLKPSGNLETLIKIDSSYTPVLEEQYVSKPISTELFQTTPWLDPLFAKMGAKGTNAIDFLKNHCKAWVPCVYTAGLNNPAKEGLKINRMELTNELVVGQTVKFNFEIPQGASVFATFNGEDSISFENQKEGELTFQEPGELIFRYQTTGRRIYIMFTYDVVPSRDAPQEQSMRAAFSNY